MATSATEIPAAAMACKLVIRSSHSPLSAAAIVSALTTIVRPAVPQARVSAALRAERSGRRFPAANAFRYSGISSSRYRATSSSP
jgi:hypothetical protein